MARSAQSQRTRYLVLLSLFTAILLVQSAIPFLGFIPLGFINLTIIHLTVVAGALVLGPKGGLWLGFVWGMASLTRAFLIGTPIERLLFTNPLIALAPRMLVPLVSWWVAHHLLRQLRQQPLRLALAGIVGSLTNTIGVLGLTYALLGPAYAQSIHRPIETLPAFLMGIVATNGLPEALAAAIIIPPLVTVLIKLSRQQS